MAIEEGINVKRNTVGRRVKYRKAIHKRPISYQMIQ